MAKATDAGRGGEAASVAGRLGALLGGLLSERGLPLLFLGYGLIAVLLIALVTPPFQVSDEHAHFFRAEQVRRGHLVGERSGGASGGVVDRGIGAALSVFWPLISHPETKATREMVQRAAAIGWGQGTEFARFENTSIYPPFLYLPSALAIKAGRALDLSVVATLQLARVVNGVLAVLLGALALVLARSAAPFLFALLALPMALSQMASVSQDALLLPVAALAAGLYARVLQDAETLGDERAETARFLALCFLLALAATGRVAYAGLALLALVPGHLPLALRLAGAALIVGAAAAWSWIAARYALVQFGLEGADAGGQVRHLLANPLRIVPLAWNTLRFQFDLYAESFVGKLGWLDLRLPWAYHAAAWAGLALAAAASFRPPGRGRTRAAWMTALAVLASAAILFAALYLTWSPVGDFIVGGVQGRYFIPLAMVLLVPFAPGGEAPGRLRQAATGAALLVFTLVSLPVVVTALVDRYYLQ